MTTKYTSTLLSNIQRRIFLLFFLLLAFSSSPQKLFGQEVLFETAALGETNQTGGLLILPYQFIGHRFNVAHETTVTAVGAHMGGGGDYFAAIVRLDRNSVSGKPLADIVGYTESSTVGRGSREYVVPMNAVLQPGRYALIYGGDYSFLPGTDTGLVPPSYLIWNGGEWVNGRIQRVNPYRFVIFGFSKH